MAWIGCLPNHFEHSRTVPIAGAFLESVFLIEIDCFFGADQFKADSPIQRLTFFYELLQCYHELLSNTFSLICRDYRRTGDGSLSWQLKTRNRPLFCVIEYIRNGNVYEYQFFTENRYA